MTFNTVEELEKYVLEQARKSLIPIQEQVYAIINRFVKEYYAEYTPEVYERTYQLYRSLVKSEIKKVGNGYVCEVYFDATQLDYSMKKFTKLRNVYGAYVNPYTRESNADGWFKNKNYSEEETLRTALTNEISPHGGYGAGTPIWTNAIDILNRNIVEIFKKYLKQNGIPIK